MRRVAVVGTTGSGKSTFAAALAGRLGVPHIELDAIYHQPNWTPLSDDEFRRRISEVVTGDGWVADGNYSKVRDLVWGAADTVVVLAYSRALVMRRVVARTFGRMWQRQELWNGNRERWTNLLSLVPEQNIIVWAWHTYDKNQERYLDALSDSQWGHLKFYRFTHPEEAADFLTRL
ncbi:MAG TPA: adenylate kinase [Acidimicrobiia bacterium]|nr:adenylate kinase [Acidimicrobiia bacterium]